MITLFLAFLVILVDKAIVTFGLALIALSIAGVDIRHYWRNSR